MNDEKKLDAALALYKQQMEHYHKTQDVEWKGTFGAWTLGVAMLWATFQPTFRMGSSRWVLLVLAIPILHCLWLLKIHNSEEEDKVFWTSSVRRMSPPLSTTDCVIGT